MDSYLARNLQKIGPALLSLSGRGQSGMWVISQPVLSLGFRTVLLPASWGSAETRGLWESMAQNFLLPRVTYPRDRSEDYSIDKHHKGV